MTEPRVPPQHLEDATAGALPTAPAAPFSLAQKSESPTKWELRASAILEDFRAISNDKRKLFRVTRGPEIHAVHESAPRVWGKLLDAMSEIERDSGGEV